MCKKCKIVFLVTVYHVCEHARTHARMRARSCIENRLSARGCTLVDQGNFALTCVSLGRDPAGYVVLWGGGVLFALVPVTVVTLYLFLGENTNFTAAASAFARADPRIFFV